MNNQRGSWLATFVAELRRRHVGRVAIAYGAAAFVLLQAGEIVLPAFDAPVWVLRLLVVVVLLGLPIALALAWVYEITPHGIRRTPDLESVPAGRGRPGHLLPRLALLAVTLVTAAGIGWWMMRWEPSDGGIVTSPADARLPSGMVPASLDPDAPIRSLAVLPFEDFSTEPQPEFAAGMQDALILQLSQIEALRVSSRTSAARYTGTTLSLPEIGRELGVQAIIEGSVTRAGNRVRIVVQLIHAPTDTHLWSKEYDRELSDILALQGEVAREIASEIEAELTPEEETQFAEAPTVNPEAHEAYLRGRYEQSKGTPEGYEAAVRYYEEALEKDSTFGPAYTGLAGSQMLLGMEDTSVVGRMLPVVLDAAEKAISFADTSPEAKAVLGAIQVQLGEVDSIATGHKTFSFKFDSLVVPNEEWLARVTEFGRQAQRIELTREAKNLQELTHDKQLGLVLRLKSLGENETAERLLKQIVEADPSNTEAWDALEHLYAGQGDYRGAIQVRQARASRAGASPEEVQAAAELATATSARDYWHWKLQELEAESERGVDVSNVSYAAALTALGEHEAAIARLEQAYEERDRHLASIWSDPIWDPLRGYPSFRELVTKIRTTRWQRERPPPR